MRTAGATTVMITGATRGLGLSCARTLFDQGYNLILTGRSKEALEAAAALMGMVGRNIRLLVLDVADGDQLDAFDRQLSEGQFNVDILINNAGVALDGADSLCGARSDVFRETLNTNFHGPLRLMQAVLPAMGKRGWGRIANVSSEMGAFGNFKPSAPAYRISKTALNAATVLAALEWEGQGVLVNAVCPGWIRTDLGGPNAPRSVEQGAASVLWAAQLPDDGPTGGFFRDGTRLSF